MFGRAPWDSSPFNIAHASVTVTVVPAQKAPPPATSPAPALPPPHLIVVKATKPEETIQSGSTSVGVLAGISVGVVAFVGLVAGGTYTVMRSRSSDRSRISKDVADKVEGQLWPEFLALDVAAWKVAAAREISNLDDDEVGVESAMVFHDLGGGTTRDFCPSAAPAMLLPRAVAGLTAELGHVAQRSGSISVSDGPDLEVDDSELTVPPGLYPRREA